MRDKNEKTENDSKRMSDPENLFTKHYSNINSSYNWSSVPCANKMGKKYLGRNVGEKKSTKMKLENDHLETSYIHVYVHFI